MAITVNQFSDLTKNAMVQWQDGRREEDPIRNMLANVTGVTERDSEHSAVSLLPTARRRTDGGDAELGNLTQGFSITMRQEEIALEVDVTKQLRMFDKYDEIMMKMRQMGQAAERRMEYDIAAFLSYAWSANYVNIDGETVTTSSPDGNTLIDPTHAVNNGAVTFTNELSATHDALSNDTYEDLYELFNGFKDEADGRSIVVKPTHMIVARHAPTIKEAQRILAGELRPGTANNDINPNRGEVELLVAPYAAFNLSTEQRDSTKVRYCFLAALDKVHNGFRIEESQGISLETPEQVFESSVWKYMTSALYDIGLLRANFISGTKGDGSAV